MELNLNITISGDATELYITDNSTGWGVSGNPEKTDIDANGMSVTIDSPTMPSPVIFDGPTWDVVNTIITLTPTDLGLPSYDVIPDEVYTFTYDLTATNFPSAPTIWTDTKDGEFVIYRTIEQNIHEDMLVELNRSKAYNCKPDYDVLRQLRRRSNLLYAVRTSEFFAETDNITYLLTYLKLLEN